MSSVVPPLVAVLLLLVLLCLMVIWRMWRALYALRHPTEVPEATLHRVWEAQEAERERLARELHDGLGALLGAAHLVLSRLLVKLTDHPAHPQLAEAQQWVAEAGQEARRLAHGMLPGVLQRLGLVEGLAAFVEGLQKAGGPTLD